jgi:hypothetical protein
MDKEHLKKTVIVAGAMIGAWGVVVGTLLLMVIFVGGSNASPSLPKKTDEKPKTSVAAPKDAKDSTK